MFMQPKAYRLSKYSRLPSLVVSYASIIIIILGTTTETDPKRTGSGTVTFKLSKI